MIREYAGIGGMLLALLGWAVMALGEGSTFPRQQNWLKQQV